MLLFVTEAFAMTDDHYLTVAQVATRLQLARETIRRMLREGRLRGVRLGARKAGWRIPASEAERLLRR
jgi:excisionase family DNA binding protein